RRTRRRAGGRAERPGRAVPFPGIAEEGRDGGPVAAAEEDGDAAARVVGGAGAVAGAGAGGSAERPLRPLGRAGCGEGGEGEEGLGRAAEQRRRHGCCRDCKGGAAGPMMGCQWVRKNADTPLKSTCSAWRYRGADWTAPAHRLYSHAMQDPPKTALI